MVYFLTWFALSVVVGMFASSRGRSGGSWFLLAMLISPLIAFIFCAASRNLKDEAALQAIKDAIPSEKTHVRCPQCAEFVLPQASVCKHCASALIPNPQFNERLIEAARAEQEENNNAILGWSIIAGTALLAWLILR